MNNKRNHSNWLPALKDAREILNKFNCHYFLDSGTLLGAVRDGGFIEWDNDIDLGVVDFNFDKSVMREMSKLFYLKGYNVSTTKSGINIMNSAGDVDLGIKFYEKDGENYITHLGHVEGSSFFSSLYEWTSSDAIYKAGYGDFKKKGLMSNILMIIRGFIPQIIKSWFAKKANIIFVTIKVSSDLLNSFTNISFYGEEFLVPKKKEEYLSLRYGDGWMNPRQNYVYYEEDGAICK